MLNCLIKSLPRKSNGTKPWRRKKIKPNLHINLSEIKILINFSNVHIYLHIYNSHLNIIVPCSCLVKNLARKSGGKNKLRENENMYKRYYAVQGCLIKIFDQENPEG